MKVGLKKRIKYLVIMLVPLILALSIKVYISTPQYAFENYREAVESGDIERAKRFTTPIFLAPDKPNVVNRSRLGPHKAMILRLRLSHSRVWRRPDATRADVTYKFSDGSYYSYFLLKTPQGWRVNKSQGVLTSH